MNTDQLRTVTLVTFTGGMRPMVFLSNADLVASLNVTYSNAGGWERKAAPVGGWQVWHAGNHEATVQEVEFRSYTDHL